jgi:hypothetical protein
VAADPPPTILHHGTTLTRARLIEANGPDPDYREPGTGTLPAAEGFSTVIGDGRPCATGTPEAVARSKHALFPQEGGPAILEVAVPAWIMALLYADPIAAGLARSGEIRFEPESGLKELLAEWHNLSNAGDPTMTGSNPIMDILAAPLAPDWTIEGLAEQVLATVASGPADGVEQFTINAEAAADRQTRRLLRPLLACLAAKAAAEAGIPPQVHGGDLSFQRPGPAGPVWILGRFDNRPGAVRLVLRQSATPATAIAGAPLPVNGSRAAAEQVIP